MTVTPDDYYKITRINHLTSNGQYLIWDEKKPNRTNNEYQSSLFLYNTITKTKRKFTSGDKLDHSPKFSPDGKMLAFLSNRKGKNQIYIIYLDGGEAHKKTNTKYGVNDFNWSKNSNSLIFTCPIQRKEDIHIQSTFNSKEEEENYQSELDNLSKKMKDPLIIEELVYREGTKYKIPNTYNHIFSLDLITNEIKQITSGNFNYSLPIFKDNHNILTSSKQDQPIHLSEEVSIFNIDLSKNNSLNLVTKYRHLQNTAIIGNNAENSFVNYISSGNPAGQISKWHLLKDNKLTPINEKLDRGILSIKFYNNHTYVTVEDTGRVDIRQFNETDNTFTKLFETKESVVDFSILDSGELYFIGTSSKTIWAIWRWTKENGVELFHDPNAYDLSSKTLIPAEEMWFKSQDGIDYQGWFFDAKDNNSNNKKPPLVLSIHGGPHAMWTDGGTMMHEWQCLASAGYSVLAINPIGSQGYGENFSQLIIPRKWGLDDARDLLHAVDTITTRIDKDRMYITGGSYAGFQTVNIISRDHRFKAAVAQRGVYTFTNFGYVTDISRWFGYQMGGTPNDDSEKLNELWSLSPLGRSNLIETPLLIIHAENDFRVPISEAEALFTSLKLQNKEVIFIRYPRDGHELSRSGEPDHVVDRIERIISWFNEHP